MPSVNHGLPEGVSFRRIAGRGGLVFLRLPGPAKSGQPPPSDTATGVLSALAAFLRAAGGTRCGFLGISLRGSGCRGTSRCRLLLGRARSSRGSGRSLLMDDLPHRVEPSAGLGLQIFQRGLAAVDGFGQNMATLLNATAVRAFLQFDPLSLEEFPHMSVKLIFVYLVHILVSVRLEFLRWRLGKQLNSDSSFVCHQVNRRGIIMT